MPSGRGSRRKGAVGEREVRDIFRAHGFACERDGRYEADLQHDIDGHHFEVKRRERIEIDKWWEQATEDAGERHPVVVFRRSKQEWRVVVTLERLLELLAAERRCHV